MSAVAPPSMHSASIPRDFPDLLNPIVVKEVRQGLRGYLFVGGFMLLHLVLVMWAFTSAITAQVSSSDGADLVFWIILVSGLFTLTVRMQGSVRGERRANTLESIQLTRQTPWRIATGKWGANMVLALLFLGSLMPYGMLRYFIGTFSLVPDTIIVLCLFCATGVFSALYLFASCLPKGIGIVLNIALGLAAIGIVVGIVNEFGGTGLRGAFSASSMSEIFGVIAGVVGFSVLYILLFLFMTAGRVTLGTEQIAFRKRLIGWLILLPACVVAVLDANKSIIFLLMLASLPVALVVLDAILTPTTASVPAFSAFGRRGFLGRIAVLFLGPSQASGVLYAVVTLLVFMLIPVTVNNAGEESVAIVLSVLNSLFLPLALAQLFSGMLGKFPLHVRYWAFYACQWIFILACYVIAQVFSFTDIKLLSCISPVGVLLSTSSMSWMTPTAFAVVHSVFIIAVLAGFMIRDFKATFKMLRGERGELSAI